MGQYFKIVNVTRKQFIDISGLGENNKFGFIGQGLNGIVLGRLLASVGVANKEWYNAYGHPQEDDLYVGAWAGHSIVVAGDNELPNTTRIESATEHANLNLYFRTEADSAYENITGKVLKWLAKDNETADMLAERAKNDDTLLHTLHEMVFIDSNEIIKNSLERIHGSTWKLKKCR